MIQHNTGADCHAKQRYRVNSYKNIYTAPCPAHKALRHGSHSFTCKPHHACLCS